MKKIILIFASIFFCIVSGCQGIEFVVTEEQAKSIVVEHHTKHIGEVKILSVTTEFNKYIITWENKDNCESGTDSVNKKGEIKNLGTSIC
jgi:hypothetical protein